MPALVSRTASQAAESILAGSGAVIRCPVMEHAVELLMAAAESGKRADIVAATDQVARWAALRQRQPGSSTR